ncbi:MAG: calcium-translocating P-type ATPase, PMCA-type [Bifidobacteriaceae bacterium]|jgi:calcium-translocating P-type ATPase|nr:calcium-translocating P-type ATPase, PMCA-type [Bifidobacteriaceae bacterium]
MANQLAGLTSEQAEASRAAHGSNALSERSTQSFWSKLLGNLGDPMIKILLVALAINVVFAFMGEAEWYESVGIAAAVIVATMVSTLSEYRNENAFVKLQEEASRISAKTWRDGRLVELPIDQLVVADVVLLQTGDKVPADGWVAAGEITLDQSALNGESQEVTKTAAPEAPEEPDFLDASSVYRGSVVLSGDARMVVGTVGNASVYGGIAAELATTDSRDSPLKVKLSDLAKGISRFGYIGGILIAVAFMFRGLVVENHFVWQAIVDSVTSDPAGLAKLTVNALILAVIIIVVAVPEGLPLMIAIVSALNMDKMLKDNVLVRKIAGIETAGSLNVLFSDKTGTITKGALETVVFINDPSRPRATFAEIPEPLAQILGFALTQNSAAVMTGDPAKPEFVGGNSTDRAVLRFVDYQRLAPADARIVAAIPFNSAAKYSATQVVGTHDWTLIKGAPEAILKRCSRRFTETGAIEPLDAAQADGIGREIDVLAERAMRVLAVAVSDEPLAADGLAGEKDLILVGVLGIRDEIRPESVAAIAEVQRAGVQVVMITGDRKDTAEAIADEAGLFDRPDPVTLTSRELREMTDEAVKDVLPRLRVISRALPSDKSRLVALSQELNLVVGMTGDGVNDSPALKKADVGFAMGSGTEVAKEAGDIVILDDNFSSIDRAILYGRTIFKTIRKFIIFQLTINISAVAICFCAPLFGHTPPLTITQMLWVNLVMDTLAALAFGGEPALSRFMDEKPIKRDAPIVSSYMWSAIGVGAAVTFGISLWYVFSGSAFLAAAYFAFFVFIAVANSFNARTESLNLFDHIGENRGFLRVIATIVVVQVALVYLGGQVFDSHGLGLTQWLVVLGCALTIIPADLIRKAIWSRRRGAGGDPIPANDQPAEASLAGSLPSL